LDAFSSDSIPAYLLTRETLQSYVDFDGCISTEAASYSWTIFLDRTLAGTPALLQQKPWLQRQAADLVIVERLRGMAQLPELPILRVIQTFLAHSPNT
jgi:hypothetical protein